MSSPSRPVRTCARAVALLLATATLSACAAGPGLVSVPFVGTLPTGGAGQLSMTSMTTGVPMQDLVEQCALMAEMTVDPTQDAALRGQLAQQMGMLGCPG